MLVFREELDWTPAGKLMQKDAACSTASPDGLWPNCARCWTEKRLAWSGQGPHNVGLTDGLPLVKPGLWIR